MKLMVLHGERYHDVPDGDWGPLPVPAASDSLRGMLLRWLKQLPPAGAKRYYLVFTREDVDAARDLVLPLTGNPNLTGSATALDATLRFALGREWVVTPIPASGDASERTVDPLRMRLAITRKL